MRHWTPAACRTSAQSRACRSSAAIRAATSSTIMGSLHLCVIGPEWQMRDGGGAGERLRRRGAGRGGNLAANEALVAFHTPQLTAYAHFWEGSPESPCGGHILRAHGRGEVARRRRVTANARPRGCAPWARAPGRRGTPAAPPSSVAKSSSGHPWRCGRPPARPRSRAPAPRPCTGSPLPPGTRRARQARSVACGCRSAARPTGHSPRRTQECRALSAPGASITLPYRFDTSSVWHTILKGAFGLNALLALSILFTVLVSHE